MLLAAVAPHPLAADDFARGTAAYERGDYHTARGYWSVLGVQGDARAQYAVGTLYEGGRGVPRDAAEAIKWYGQAAAQDHPQAQHRLGLLLDGGTGGQRDPERAYVWLALAVHNGVPQAVGPRDKLAAELTAEQRERADATVQAWLDRKK